MYRAQGKEEDAYLRIAQAYKNQNQKRGAADMARLALRINPSSGKSTCDLIFFKILCSLVC